MSTGLHDDRFISSVPGTMNERKKIIKNQVCSVGPRIHRSIIFRASIYVSIYAFLDAFVNPCVHLYIFDQSCFIDLDSDSIVPLCEI